MILGSKGYPVSFECSELIRELRKDIQEFGKDKLFAVFLRNYSEHGIEVAVNYDFIVDADMIDRSELSNDERIVIMTAESLLDFLLKQNDPIRIYEIGEAIV